MSVANEIVRVVAPFVGALLAALFFSYQVKTIDGMRIRPSSSSAAASLSQDQSQNDEPNKVKEGEMILLGELNATTRPEAETKDI